MVTVKGVVRTLNDPIQWRALLGRSPAWQTWRRTKTVVFMGEQHAARGLVEEYL